MTLAEFFSKNAIAIIIAVVGVVSSYAAYGFKITTLEHQQQEDRAALEAQISENKENIAELEKQTVDVKVQLAQIATDIQYIKVNIDRLLK